MYPFKIQFVLLGIPLDFGPYALFFFLAAATAVTGVWIFAVKRGFRPGQMAGLILVMLVSAVIGARLLNALINWQIYAVEPGKLLALGVTGFSLYGGGIAAVLSGWLYYKMAGLNVYKMADTFIPFLGISVAMMRIGCFLQGCCFGVETTLPIGVKFPLLSPAHIHQMGIHGNFLEVNAVHPTQLYELAAGVILSIIAFKMLRKNYADGVTMLTVVALFSLFRIFNGFLRVRPEGSSAPAYFYPLLYAGLILLCLFLILSKTGILKRKSGWPEPFTCDKIYPCTNTSKNWM
ncbi:MAG TPA: prolipoprotein diacylglyceryl transferase [Candidatus Gracilibacteria bacterium]|nr:prolipoprotein diacylglyceryl transferase [Candidatus Gracilibacteria bacterium]